MTVALRAHRLLCRLGLHLDGRWHTRKEKSGEYVVCASCKRDRWRPDKPVSLFGKSFDDLGLATNVAKGFPVDRLNFPAINRAVDVSAPRDGVTHEG